jgi:hypothetical protein
MTRGRRPAEPGAAMSGDGLRKLAYFALLGVIVYVMFGGA